MMPQAQLMMKVQKVDELMQQQDLFAPKLGVAVEEAEQKLAGLVEQYQELVAGKVGGTSYIFGECDAGDADLLECLLSDP